MTAMNRSSHKNAIHTPLGERIFYWADALLMILLCVLILSELLAENKRLKEDNELFI